MSIKGPECVEKAPEVGQCWDCPSRKGINKFIGKLAFRFWSKDVFFGAEHIEQQQAGCRGWVPANILRQSSGSFVEKDGRALTENEHNDLYFRACPQTVEEVPEFPDEVHRAMRANNLLVFVHSYASVTDRGSVEEVEQQRAEIRERFAEHIAATKNVEL